MLPIVKDWLSLFYPGKDPELLGSNTLKFLGNVGAESTFLGIPVSSTNIEFQFGLPQDQGAVGKIRLLVGSLGVSSGSDWDPEAAWLGLSLTALIDLAIPTYALLLTVGVESNKIFDEIFKDVKFPASHRQRRVHGGQGSLHRPVQGGQGHLLGCS